MSLNASSWQAYCMHRDCTAQPLGTDTFLPEFVGKYRLTWRLQVDRFDSVAWSDTSHVACSKGVFHCLKLYRKFLKNAFYCSFLFLLLLFIYLYM